MPTPMMGAHLTNPTISVPANPPLHRAVMDSCYASYLLNCSTTRPTTTSTFVERQNLALSQFNFVRIQRTLRVTPERATGVTDQG